MKNPEQSQDLSRWLYSKRSTLKSCSTIAFAAGKGGVGKTTLSLRVGLELAQRGFKVLLIDADFNLSNSSLKLGLPVNNDFASFVSGKAHLREILLHTEGLDILPGCQGSLDLFENEAELGSFFAQTLGRAEQDYQFILFDCPAGAGRFCLDLAQLCEKQVMVVTPDKSSLTDSYSFLKLLWQRNSLNSPHILANMVSNQKQGLKLFHGLRETAKRFLNIDLCHLGSIPWSNQAKGLSYDPFFRKSSENGRYCLWQNFSQVAEKLSEASSLGSENFGKADFSHEFSSLQEMIK